MHLFDVNKALNIWPKNEVEYKGIMTFTISIIIELNNFFFCFIFTAIPMIIITSNIIDAFIRFIITKYSSFFPRRNSTR